MWDEEGCKQRGVRKTGKKEGREMRNQRVGGWGSKERSRETGQGTLHRLHYFVTLLKRQQ